MRESHSSHRSGYALIVLCLLVFSLTVVLAVGLADQFTTLSQNNSDTSAFLKQVKEAIIGAPDRDFFGYLGDTGDYPLTLTDLLANPGGTVFGWKGPYLSKVDVTSGMILDRYLSPLEFYLDGTPGTFHKLAIISTGPDHSSTNTASNPNVASQFTGVVPDNASYSAGTGNSDNFGSDLLSDVNSLKYTNFGSVKVQLLNDESFQNPGVVDVCPGQYSLEIKSATRGTNDMLTIPADRITLHLLQGMWDVRATSVNMSKEAYAGRLTSRAGGGLTQKVMLRDNDASESPTGTITVTNNLASTITMTRFDNGFPSGGFTVTAGNTGMASVNTCMRIAAKTGGVNGTIQYEWINRYGVNQSVVVGTASSTLTVTNNAGGYRQLIVWVHGATLASANPLGNVADREVRTFSIMNGNTVWISDGAGAQLDTFVVNSTTNKSY